MPKSDALTRASGKKGPTIIQGLSIIPERGHICRLMCFLQFIM